jgi:hypothetical protein
MKRVLLAEGLLEAEVPEDWVVRTAAVANDQRVDVATSERYAEWGLQHLPEDLTTVLHRTDEPLGEIAETSMRGHVRQATSNGTRRRPWRTRLTTVFASRKSGPGAHGPPRRGLRRRSPPRPACHPGHGDPRHGLLLSRTAVGPGACAASRPRSTAARTRHRGRRTRRRDSRPASIARSRVDGR